MSTLLEFIEIIGLVAIILFVSFWTAAVMLNVVDEIIRKFKRK